MRFGSVCSGIEAASVAWNPLGWEAAWFSEIEPFPCALLAHHYPNVPNLGDMTTIAPRILSGEVEAPDILCGGTPCQAFSVAGLRKSLDDVRGNLSLVFCELANAIDTARFVRGLPPSIIFWENVPGVLNTKDNAFGCFLAGLARLDVPLEVPGGKWGGAGYVLTGKRAVAWRTLDAQYFGVPQRRRRVFVVASSRDGIDPCQILFERAGVQRNPAPVGTPGKAPAAFAEGSFGAFRASCVASTCKASGGCLGGGSENLVLSNGSSLSPTIDASIYSKNNQQDNSKLVIYENHAQDARYTEKTTCPTVTSRYGTGGGNIPLTIYTKEGHPSAADEAQSWREAGKAKTLNCFTAGSESRAEEIVVTKACERRLTPVDVPLTLFNVHSQDARYKQDKISSALTASMDNLTDIPIAGNKLQVRRLTPVECERLQGFPDNYTRIPYRGKPESECPDGPRYKAIGNSWAVPVVRWIGKRIKREVGE